MKIIYVATGVISLIIYIAGIFTGVFIQSSISQSINLDLASIKSDIENQQQELLMLTLRGKESCAILKSLSSNIALKLESASNKIREFEQNGQKGEEFDLMKETYSSLSIRAWILMSSINENCKTNSIPILYYYSFPCEKCKDQERILEYVKSLDKDRILIYAVDKGINSSLVELFVKSHNIQISPSLVISNETYIGFTNNETLNKIICREINISCA